MVPRDRRARGYLPLTSRLLIAIIEPGWAELLRYGTRFSRCSMGSDHTPSLYRRNTVHRAHWSWFPSLGPGFERIYLSDHTMPRPLIGFWLFDSKKWLVNQFPDSLSRFLKTSMVGGTSTYQRCNSNIVHTNNDQPRYTEKRMEER